MKRFTIFHVATILSILLLTHALLMSNVWSLLTSGLLIALVLWEIFIRERTAPHAEEFEVADAPNLQHMSDHQRVYVRALESKMMMIQLYRDLWRKDTGGIGDIWYSKYDQTKMIYSRLFVRYQEAKQKYGWEQ